MSGHNDAHADGQGRVYQALGDQQIEEHHHHGPAWSGPDSVRRPALGRPPAVLRDRVELMEQLRAVVASDAGGQAYVLHGLGGCGKTAVAYALFQYATAVGDRIGLWVNASDTASLRAGMLAVAADRSASEAEMTAARSGLRAAADLVWDRLDQSDRPWLLVLDNADDPAVLQGGWLRASPRGIVLVTTRQASARWWPETELLHIGVLPREDAARVLCDLAPGSGTVEEAAEVADRLGRLPLALTLAGSFLAHQVLDPWTMSRYGHHLGGDLPADPIELLDQGAVVLGNDGRHLVSRTWQFSLDALTDQGLPEAHALLRLLACWSNDPVPLSLLVGAELGSQIPALRTDAALRGLLDHSLTDLLAGEPRCLRTHGVLLESVARSTPPDDRGPLAAKAAELLLRALPEVPQRGQRNPLLQLLGPHVLALLRRVANWPEVDRSVAEAAAEGALRLITGLHRSGDYESALASAEQAALLVKRSLGEEHPATIRIRQRIGRALFSSGRTEEAEALHRQVLATCERLFGETAPTTLESVLGLGLSLSHLGHTSEAVSLLRRAVAGRTEALGPAHPLTLMARDCLLTVDPGPELEEEVRGGASLVADCHRELGARHPLTLAVELDFAYATWATATATGSSAEVLPRARGALAALDEHLGSEHPMTLSARTLVGQVLAGLGDLPEAITHMEAVLDLRLRVLGPDHPITRNTREFLAAYRQRLRS